MYSIHFFSKDWSTEEQSPPIELQECTISESVELQEQQQHFSSNRNIFDKEFRVQISPQQSIQQQQPQPSTSKQIPRLGQLPALSVSGPSPPHEQEQLL